MAGSSGSSESPKPPEHVAVKQEQANGAPGPAEQQQQQAGAEEEGDFETSFFPNPPSYYKRYTAYNLAIDDADRELQTEGGPVKRSELEPPNVDWVVERGSYDVFGQTWPIEEASLSLEDMDVQVLYNKSDDRKSSLQSLLRAMLVTYFQLVKALQKPPPSFAEPPRKNEDGSDALTEPERLVEHMRLIGVNMHHLINELRPVQARDTLNNMLILGTEQRRAKTVATKARLEEIERSLQELRTTVADTVNEAITPAPLSNTTASNDPNGAYDLAKLRSLTGS